MKFCFVKCGVCLLLLMMFIDLCYMLVFGLNSLFQEIFDEYGILNVW